MPALVYGEVRAAWIGRYEGESLCQTRRAERLGRALRARARSRAALAPDAHDDKITPRLIFRKPNLVDTLPVLLALVAAPVGWPVGFLAYRVIVRLIPDHLRAYPIPALLWAGVVCGWPLPAFYDGSGDLWSVFEPAWYWAQIPATFFVAGVYGILEGWLAIDGSGDCWPLTPLAPVINAELMLRLPMTTVFDPPPKPEPKRKITFYRTMPAQIRWLPLAGGAVFGAALILWFYFEVFSALLAPH